MVVTTQGPDVVTTWAAHIFPPPMSQGLEISGNDDISSVVIAPHVLDCPQSCKAMSRLYGLPMEGFSLPKN